LDSVTGEKITDLLFGLNAERDTTLLLVTHDQRVAARCDTILRIDAGRLLPQTQQEQVSA
ncbi:MAG: hypothetical protein KJO55_04620, partial [Gammaproteobacteria bacterium]|nr:hypothetical protein [Gammaproteobacteria bacterium]